MKGADPSGKAFGPGQKLSGIDAEPAIFVHPGFKPFQGSAPALPLKAGENKVFFLFIKTDFHNNRFQTGSGRFSKGYAPDIWKAALKGFYVGIIVRIWGKQLCILNGIKAEGGQAAGAFLPGTEIPAAGMGAGKDL